MGAPITPEKVKDLLRGLPAVTPPLFPGPVPGRGAPALMAPIRPQLEPIRPLRAGGPKAPRSGPPASALRPKRGLFYQEG